jgi:hypothetical protein
MSGRIAYCQQRSLLSADAALGGFTHVIGQHANELVNIIVSDKKSLKKDMANAWKRIGSVNDTWIGLLCINDDEKEGEFKKIASCLVHGYTESVGDFIFDGTCYEPAILKLTELEGKFYSALHGPSGHDSTTKKKWIQYTNALIDYVNVTNKFGPENDYSWSYAADVLVTGRMLGYWLDQSLLLKK